MASNTTLENIVPELLTTAEAARLLSMGERTLWRHSRSGAAPAPVKIGGTLVRYRRSELLDWIEAGCPPTILISINTVRKQCIHLQKLLDRAGPKTRRNRSTLAKN
ncbi:MAG TPA: helix-turn-helix domain-containing protein [Thermoguttaceae bacterium]